jgi:glycosyltransferase involved in cell wall biosynthesis
VIFLFPYMARWRAANWTRYHQLLTHLCHKGHQVIVLEPPPLTLDETNFIDLDIALPEGMSVIQVPVPLWQVKTPWQKLVKRGLYTLACRSVMRKIMAARAIDVVILYNLPQWVLLQKGPWLTVFDVPDDLTAMLEHELGWLGNRGICRVAEALQNRMVAQCQVVTTTSTCLLKRLGEKAVVVPNGVCLREAAGKDGEKLRAQYRPPVVGYIGAFEYFVDFDMVLTAARSLREVTFLLVGAGRELAAIRKRVAQEGLTNVILPGPVPHHLVFNYIAAMDICLIPFRQSAVGEAACPLKLFEYAGAQRPVISTPVREVQTIGKEFVTFASDARELQQTISGLLHSPQRRAALVAKGVEVVERQYTWDALTEQFLRLVDTAREGVSSVEALSY